MPFATLALAIVGALALAAALDTVGAVVAIAVGMLTALGLIGGAVYQGWKLVRVLARIADAMPTLLVVAQQWDHAEIAARLDRIEVGQRALLMDRGYATFDDLTTAHAHEAGAGVPATRGTPGSA